MGNDTSTERKLIEAQEKQIQELKQQNMNILHLLKDMYQKVDFEKDERRTVTIEGKEYQFKEKLGQGGFGIVYKALYNNQIYAIKEIKVSEENATSILAELKFIMFIKQSFSEKVLPVITIYGAELIDQKIYYAMEFAQMPLTKMFENISKSEIKLEMSIIMYFFVLRALLFLESIDVVHSDIKPDNFVVINDPSSQWKFNIKLIDFGTVKKIDMLKSKIETASIAGTLVYMAPEAFSGIVHKKSDIWSIGIMLYQLIYDEYPEYIQNERTIQMFALSDREINFPRCPDKFSNLLGITRKCLTKNVNNRVSASELYVLSKKSYSNICDMVITELYANSSNIGNIRDKYKQLNTRKIQNGGGNYKDNSQQRRCFVRGCNAILPINHEYNRCDNCFNTKCLLCFKPHTPGYKFRRCPDCYAKHRNKN